MLEELKKVAYAVGNVASKIPDVSAVAIYGSLAQGYADKHSDINLIVICSSTPKPESRRKVFEKNFEWIVFKNDTMPAWRTKTQDFLFVDGKQVTIVYRNYKNLKHLADEIAADVHMSRTIFREAVYYISNTKVIKDPRKLFAQLRKKIPPATPKLLEYFLPDLEYISAKDGWPYSSIKQAVDRGNYIYVDQIISLQLENFLICLHAINNKHYASPKWAMRSLRSLKLKPQATLPRIQKISKLGNSSADLDRKINLLQSLVSDLNKLILKEKIFTF